MGKQELLALLLIIGDVVIIAIVVFFLNRYYSERLKKDRQNQADSIIGNAKENAKTIELEAKDNAIKILKDAEEEITRRRNENLKEEERLHKRRSEIDNRIERLELREQTINKRQSLIDKRSNEIEKMYAQQLGELQRIAQMSVEEAREILLQEAEKEGRSDMARIIRQIEAEARAEGEKRAREIVADAIQRVASEHVNEVTTSIVILPNEEMKGRIVGRNGRNIRAF
jgi:ribonuclease Y